MSVDQIGDVYRDAADCGIRILTIWGGEPLVRPDLPEILEAARRAELMTVLITSGYRLADCFEEVVPKVDSIIFSLDDLGARHDEMRGMPGLFDSVCSSLGRIRGMARGPKVFINSVISRLNEQAVDGLVALAGDLGVWIYLHPIETGMLGRPGEMQHKEGLACEPDVVSRICRRLIELRSAGYPVANSRTYLRKFIGGKKPYRCHARKVCIEMRPNGDLMDCLDRGRPVANVIQSSLREILGRPEIRRRRLQDVDCQACNNANVIDTSAVWELNVDAVFTFLGRQM